MDKVPTLAEFLADCEYVYLNGTERSIRSITSLIIDIKKLLKFKNKQTNGVYELDEHSHHKYDRH
jgi:hypothetical protein